MDLRKTVDDRGGVARTLLTAALGFVAVRSLRNGKRTTGALAGAGAVAVGLTAKSDAGEPAEGLDIDASIGDTDATEENQLHCAACGEPIVPGQSRGPNENDEIVHDACVEA